MLTDNSSKIEGMERFRGMAGSSSSGQTGGLAGLPVVSDSEAPEKSVRRRLLQNTSVLFFGRRETAKSRVGWAPFCVGKGYAPPIWSPGGDKRIRGPLEAISPKKTWMKGYTTYENYRI
jgi:hypothetical protein